MVKRFLLLLVTSYLSWAFHTSGWALTSPRPGTPMPFHVKMFLQEAQKRYGEGNLAQLMRQYRLQKQAKAEGLRVSTSFSDTLHFKFPVLVGKYADSGSDQWPIRKLQMELFDGPWPTGTMKEYYLEVSYGQFNIGGQVFGWYQVPETAAYYENGVNGLPWAQGPNGRGRAPQFVRDLIAAADAEVDFRPFDNNKDGVVETIFIVHYGLGGEYGGPEIWSHQTALRYYGGVYQTNDGVIIDDYIIQPAMSSNKDQMIEIGVFCHEFGHALGLPDLYDTDNSSEGIGEWGLMGSGSWGGNGRHPEKPTHPCAWSKEQMSWVTPIVLSENLSQVELPQVESHPVVYKLWKQGQIEPYPGRYGVGIPNVGREYFLLENRQPVGFDQYIHSGGLLIWHIDNSIGNNQDEIHPLVDLEEADGSMQGRGDPGDPFPGTSKNRRFDYWTLPNSRGYNGSNSEVAAINISDPDPLMTADLEVVETQPTLFYHSHQVTDVTGNNNNEPEPGETVTLVVSLLNYGAEMTGAQANLSTDDPDIQFSKNQVRFDNIPFNSIGDNSTDPFIFTVSQTAAIHRAHFVFDLRSNNGAYLCHLEFDQLIGHPDILLVDDDYQAEPDPMVFDVEQYYQAALDSVRRFYSYWDYETRGVPDSLVLQTYQTVIWYTGYAKPTLTQEDQQNLTAFLNQGGQLFISGQDLGTLAQEPNSRDFYNNYLQADFVEKISNQPYLLGATGDPIANGIRLLYNTTAGARNQVQPDVIAPKDNATPIFSYFPARKTAGIKYAGRYKLVYLAFGFEAIADVSLNGPRARALVLQRILDWFEASTSVDSPAENLRTPVTYALEQNYPNPFGYSTTRIVYHLPRPDAVSLKIYNVLGQLIKILVDERKEAGYHAVLWDGTNELG
ncbi:MAG: M6 family metalloprotease domain-containing protein, partial [candidate division KSB1 bacterium]|nr:M6 family metalloprotease domain-containing protein [candidate division KSB1 bacterium]